MKRLHLLAAALLMCAATYGQTVKISIDGDDFVLQEQGKFAISRPADQVYGKQLDNGNIIVRTVDDENAFGLSFDDKHKGLPYDHYTDANGITFESAEALMLWLSTNTFGSEGGGGEGGGDVTSEQLNASQAAQNAEIAEGYQPKKIDVDVVLFGDSITAQADSWASTFDSIVAPNTLVNMAVGGQVVTWGASTIETTDVSGENNVFWNSIKKWEADYPGAEPDVIIIANGTNDYGREWGSYSAAFSQDEAATSHLTLAGAARKALHYLRTNYPNTKIYWSLPIQSGRTGKEYVVLNNVSNIIRAVCNRMGVVVFESLTESGIAGDFENDTTPGTFLADGIHPNAAGSALLGRYIASEFINHYID